MRARNGRRRYKMLPRTKSQSNAYRFDGLPRFLLMRARNGRRRYKKMVRDNVIVGS